MLEVSVTDVVPESAPENGVPSRPKMWFVGLSKEETPRLITFGVDREMGQQMLKDLVTGEEPVAFIEAEDILLIQDLTKIQPALAQRAMSPFGAVEAAGLRPIKVVQAEQNLLRVVERWAQAQKDLIEVRKHSTDLFEPAQLARNVENSAYEAMAALASAWIEEWS